MIADALLTIVFALISPFFLLLPEVDMDAVWPGWGPVLPYLDDLNYWLPLAEVMTVVAVILAVGTKFISITLGLYIAAWVRGSSSVG